MPTHPKTVAVFGPKGGIGKTTISANLIIAAATAGMKVIGVDADPQKSLSLWYHDRKNNALADQIVNVDVVEFDLKRYTKVIEQAAVKGYDLVVFDTGPSVEGREATINLFVEEVDFILIPIQQTDTDRKTLLPWMQHINTRAKHAEFVINRAIPQRRSYKDTKKACVHLGISPIDVPFYEDIPKFMAEGLSVAEVVDAMGHSEITMLWSHIAHVLNPVRKAA